MTGLYSYYCIMDIALYILLFVIVISIVSVLRFKSLYILFYCYFAYYIHDNYNYDVINEKSDMLVAKVIC